MTLNPRSLCVYCGSSDLVAEVYRSTASELGARLAALGIGVIYGGGNVGLMGILADAALSSGGHVTGIIPEFLRRKEVGHGGVTELVVVDTMHERKQRMADSADGFVILPGGFGTLEEFFEILTWRQLRLHDKPIFILDVEGYWKPLSDLLQHVIASGFAHESARRLWQVVPSIDALLDALSRQSSASHPTRFDLG